MTRGKVLIYMPTGDDLPKLKMVCAMNGMKIIILSREDLKQRLGYLAGEAGFEKDDTRGNEKEINQPMLVFCGIDSDGLDKMILGMRSQKIRIPYKAVMTNTNSNWRLEDLFGELVREHAVMSGQVKAKEKS